MTGADDRRSGTVFGERFLARDDLLGRAGRVAAGLAGLGVQPGDRVALLMRNDPAFIEISIGAGLIGAYAVPLNFHAMPDEISWLLADADARVIFAHGDLLAACAAALPSDVIQIAVPTPAEIKAAFRLGPSAASERTAEPLAFDDWLAGHTIWSGPQRPAPQSMIYTSGTTGRPKGVRRRAPYGAEATRIEQMRTTVYGVRPGGRTLLPGPLYHTAPNSFGLRAARLSERFVLMPRFDPEVLLRDIQRHRIDTVLMVPTMFVRLLRLSEEVRRRYDLSSLRHVVHAAAPCPVDVKRAMIEWLGQVVVEFYGGTEVGSVTFCTSAEWLTHPGTVGRPVDSCTLRVLDDAGVAVPPGHIGEIFSRIADYPDFTYHKREADRAAVERDGLITMGDLGYFDQDGYLYVCDRKGDMVIVGGTNIYPAEIEAVLLAAPGVKDCAVFGIPDPEYGEVLVAVVAPVAPGATSSEHILRYLGGRLSGFKIPRLIELRAELPREDSGKVFKRLLRADFTTDGRSRSAIGALRNAPNSK